MKHIARFLAFVVFLTLTILLADLSVAASVMWSCPEKENVKGLPDKAPTREEYISLLKEVTEHYGKKLTPDTRSEIDAILARARTPTEAADAGAALMLKRVGSASVYSISKGALRAPDDILTANNLGVALEGMYDVKRALRVLLYAKGARPKSPLVEINTAYVYFNIGDMKTAKEHFKKAEDLDPRGHSSLGLGLIAHCEGRHPDAIRYLTASRYAVNSDIGDSALKKSKRAQKKADKEATAAEGEFADGASLMTWPSNLERDEGAADDIKFPEIPLLSGSIEKDAALGEAYKNLYGELSTRLAAVNMEIISATNPFQSRSEQTDSGELYFNFKREVSTLRELLDVHKQKAHLAFALHKSSSNEGIKKVLDNFDKSTQGLTLLTMEPALIEYGIGMCKETHKKAKEDYDSAFKLWKTLNDMIVPDTRNYMAYSNPLLEKIYDKELNAMQNRKREYNLLGDYLAVTVTGMVAATQAVGYYQTTNCEAPKKPAQGQSGKSAFDIKNQDPNCPFETPVKIGFPKGVNLVSIQISCTKAKLEVGTGLMGSLERDFKKKETTVFVGAGANTDASIFGGGAKAGFSMTTDSRNELKDIAVEASASAKTGIVENEVTARLGFESGPSLTHETGLAF